jgi:cystathionine beta-lyase/cystathionine gamma-synthase
MTAAFRRCRRAADLQTSLFTFSSYEEMEACFSGKLAGPSIRAASIRQCALRGEGRAAGGAEDALGFGSGMAAISSSVLAFVRPGDRILSVEHVYPDSFRFFETVLSKLGRRSTTSTEAISPPWNGCCPAARSSTWKARQLDVPGARPASACRAGPAHGAVSIVDNSWASPIFQIRSALCCDLSLHSASKYLGGHSDVVAGVVAGRGELIGKLRRRNLP